MLLRRLFLQYFLIQTLRVTNYHYVLISFIGKIGIMIESTVFNYHFDVMNTIIQFRYLRIREYTTICRYIINYISIYIYSALL